MMSEQLQQSLNGEGLRASGNSTGNKPAHTLRYGNVKAAVWRKEVDLGNASRAMYHVTFSRSYKDQSDVWRDSGSFGPKDLLVLAKLADEAHTFIFKQKARDKLTAGHVAPPVPRS